MNGQTLAYETKEEVMEWMLDIQLGRRNLSPIQRIAIAEKYRPIYEKQAKERQSNAGGDKKSDKYKKSVTENLPQANNNEKKERNPTTDKHLSDMAGVSEKTYRMGAKILNSDNEDLKQRVLSGETAISTVYKELIGKKQNVKVEDNNAITSTTQPTITSPTPQKTQISDEVRQICEDFFQKCLKYKKNLTIRRRFIIMNFIMVVMSKRDLKAICEHYR